MRLNLASMPFYLKNGIDETQYSQEAYDRFEKLEIYKRLMKEGCTETTTLAVLKISRTTLHRWKRNYKKYGF